MTQENLIKVLKQKDYEYYKKGDGLFITHQGYVYLQGLTTLPANIKFENQGGVNLRRLTTLPANTKFENQGSVDLDGLTTLPANTKFENQGSVNLRRLTTLPENIKFENQGYVDLDGLHNKEIIYQGKKIHIKHIDGYTMIISSSKSVDDFTIHKAKYFKGDDLKKLPKCFIAERGNYYAHGETIEEATSDVNFKYLQENADIQEIIREVKEKKTVTVEEYMLITGACAMGVKMFMDNKNITATVLPLNKVLEITKGHYGGSKMLEIFKG